MNKLTKEKLRDAAKNQIGPLMKKRTKVVALQNSIAQTSETLNQLETEFQTEKTASTAELNSVLELLVMSGLDITQQTTFKDMCDILGIHPPDAEDDPIYRQLIHDLIKNFQNVKEKMEKAD